MWKWASLIFIVFLIVGGSVALVRFQGRLLFFPGGERFGDCSELTALRTIPVQAKVEDQTIRYYWKEHPKALATLIFFHGNAGSACDRAMLVRELGEIGLNVALVEYPGYGQDSTPPGEAVWLKNAGLVFREIERNNRGNKKIILFGESIGTAVATKVAADHAVDGLILQSPFPSILEVAKLHYPWLPVESILVHTFAAEDWARLVRAKTLILHGDADRVVPLDFGKRQAANFLSLDSVVVFEGFGHNDLQVNHEAFWNAVRMFILQIVGDA